VKKSRLLLTTTKGLANKPVLDGVEIDSVVGAQIVVTPFDLPTVTLQVQTDVVFNGRAWVRLVDIVPESGPDARREFANVLNEADLRARTKQRDWEISTGARPKGQRRLPESADVAMLIEEMEALGWGFYRTRRKAR